MVAIASVGRNFPSWETIERGGNPASLPSAMDQDIHVFVLQKHSPRSHTYVGELRCKVDRLSEDTETLKEIVREDIKSRREFKSWGEDIDIIAFEAYLVRRHQIPTEAL
jgi:hypothetical protein